MKKLPFILDLEKQGETSICKIRRKRKKKAQDWEVADGHCQKFTS